MEAARVPDWFTPHPVSHGLWTIRRMAARDATDRPEPVGWPHYTLLTRGDSRTMHLEHGTVVMEDSQSELRQHLPMMMAAHGRVLVTGLGLGCVVRGLLANPRVLSVDVVERDPWIANTIWPATICPAPPPRGWTFEYGGRATLYVADAFEFVRNSFGKWDYAWHDLHSDPEEPVLGLQHAELINLLRERVRYQGAWGWERKLRKRLRRIIPRRHALGLCP
jgi:spermidine synthase